MQDRSNLACTWQRLGATSVRAALASVIFAALALPLNASAADPVTTINSSIATTDPTQSGRLERNGNISTCSTPNFTFFQDFDPHHHKSFAISSLLNESACLTFAVSTACTGLTDIQSAVYDGSFPPTNPVSNLISAAGASATAYSYEATSLPGRVLVLAVNTVEVGAACPAFTYTVTSDKPWATVRPQSRLAGSDASGRQVVTGDVLSAVPGTFTAAHTDSYQWRSCNLAGTACVDIAGATGQSFGPGRSLNGRTIRVRNIASNASGTSSTDSAATGRFISSDFSFGKLTRNKSNGTATLLVDVPGAGVLTLRGKGIVPKRQLRSARAAAVGSRTVDFAGKVKLLITTKGKRKRKLDRNGKVKVKARVAFRALGGAKVLETRTVRLKKTL